ncbi:MAG TPA: tetratricopeptide repeat-containing protein, partial [Nevskiaceae bacterium]|nr:tetratricopeptide repeat-containing protein [Nevskiaceae bacterium]
ARLRLSATAGTYRVGAAGHLLLSLAEEARIRGALQTQILPALVERAGGQRLLLMAGLAPGADLLFLHTARRWMRERRLPVECLGLLPVPPDLLLRDWIDSAIRQGYTLTAGDRLQLEAELESGHRLCDEVLPLFDQTTPLERLEDREQQYQRLSSLLVQHSEALVVMLRPGDSQQPGGTAETLRWWQDPGLMPAALREAGVLSSGARPVYRIDPANTESVAADGSPPVLVERVLEGVLEQARAAARVGNDIACNDLVWRALRALPEGQRAPAELARMRVHTLIRLGSLDQALKEYQRLAPAEAQRDAAWLSLLGRLRKDLGLRSGRRTHFLAAAEAYARAGQLASAEEDAYNALNAATSLALAQEMAAARPHAEHARALSLKQGPADEVAAYYRCATLAECALLLGRTDEAVEWLHQANRYLPGDVIRRGATRRQLRRLCEVLAVEVDVLAALGLPPILLVRRLGSVGAPELALRASELRQLPAHAPAYLGLCDGFDLGLAEALIDAGVAVHLGLPMRADLLSETLRAEAGAGAAERLQRCLAAARSVSPGRGFLPGAEERAWAAHEVTRRNFGLALQQAQRQGSGLQVVEVQPQTGEPLRLRLLPEMPPGAEQARLARAQIATESAPVWPRGRRMVGLIFADFAGFQRMSESQLPAFWDKPMRAIADRLDRHGRKVLLRSTWGDALHVVTEDAVTVGELLADIQETIALYALRHDGVLGGMNLRMAGHYGPVYEGEDPIQRQRTYFGTQLSLTARIEPVTPPGMVYATEALAAELATEAPGRFNLEYVGEIELAKRFGSYRLYALNRQRR